MTSASQIVTAYMEQTRQDLIASYQEKGLKASGRYAKGLTFEVSDDGKTIKAFMESEHHVWFMEQGRKPNKKKSVKELIGFALWASDEDSTTGGFITRWLKDKGIMANAFAVAYKIGEQGIQVPNRYNPGDVVEDVVTNEWFDGLVAQLADHFIFAVTTEVERLFRK